MAEGQPVDAQPAEDIAGALHLFQPESKPADIASAGGKYLGSFNDPEHVTLGLMPPFTTLDRRQGPWQERAKQWKKLGIEGELGMKSDEGRREGSGAFNSLGSITGGNYGKEALDDKPISIFDPVLCEMTYRWFCPEQGTVLDPFAGGSVRGIIAGSLGRNYVGVDLNPEQVEANEQQRETIQPPAGPLWVAGDSREVLADGAGVDLEADLVFTCPPYGDLEVYSSDPRDLSNMTHAAFDAVYGEILASATNLLRQDRFAVVVVGNYRTKKGGYLRDLVGITVRAMEEAGLHYYNEAIILDPIGTAAVRAPRQFSAQRKLVRVHQSYLVFVKGNPKEATVVVREGVAA